MINHKTSVPSWVILMPSLYVTLSDTSNMSLQQSYRTILNTLPLIRTAGTMGFNCGCLLFCLKKCTIAVATAWGRWALLLTFRFASNSEDSPSLSDSSRRNNQCEIRGCAGASHKHQAVPTTNCGYRTSGITDIFIKETLVIWIQSHSS